MPTIPPRITTALRAVERAYRRTTRTRRGLVVAAIVVGAAVAAQLPSVLLTIPLIAGLAGAAFHLVRLI